MNTPAAPRVRFAPSPTGNVHIGNLRVAIFNYLYARHNHGAFLLRVEDTDRERSTPEAIQNLLAALRWMGLEHDEEVFYQSRQAEKHRAAAGEMVARGFAAQAPDGPVTLLVGAPLFDPSFVTEPGDRVEVPVAKGEVGAGPRGFDYVTTGSDGARYHTPYLWDALEGLEVLTENGTLPGDAVRRLFDGLPPLEAPLPEAEWRARLADGHPAASGRVLALRFRRRHVFFDDLVLGRLEKPLDSLRDLVIVRSDGNPVFHLANVVDDLAQNVSHILRGNDHVENTYRHLFLYRALGRTPPVYGHFPMIVNAKGKPYSKRDGDAYVGDFRDKGFLPAALLNFLALCGWGDEHGREILSCGELADAFTLERVSAAPAQINLEKLSWMNGQYLSRMPVEELLPLVRAELERADVAVGGIDPSWLARLVELERERLRTVVEFVANTRFFFVERVDFDPAAVAKFLHKKQGRGYAALAGLSEALAGLPGGEAGWTEVEIEKAARAYGAERQLGLGDLAQPLRVAVTGTGVSRGIWKTLELLGRERALGRIGRALAECAPADAP